jgi:hypothetical protein
LHLRVWAVIVVWPLALHASSMECIVNGLASHLVTRRLEAQHIAGKCRGSKCSTSSSTTALAVQHTHNRLVHSGIGVCCAWVEHEATRSECVRMTAPRQRSLWWLIPPQAAGRSGSSRVWPASSLLRDWLRHAVCVGVCVCVREAQELLYFY